MSLVATILRATDFLHIQLELLNLRVDVERPGGPHLVHESNGPAYIVLRLPPQHIAEEAFTENGTRPRVRAGFVAAPSRLTFELPNGSPPIPFTVDALLNRIAGLAAIAPDDEAAHPGSIIEFPRGLLLVPQGSCRLHHRTVPVTSPDAWTELWQTRLVPQAGAGRLRFRPLPNDFDTEGFQPGALTALSLRDRRQIVENSLAESDPHSISGQLFALTSLGGSTRLRGEWNAEGVNLSAWHHHAELGRDTVVRTVKQGFLFPFRHRASLTTITARRFSPGSGLNVAELIQQEVLTLTDTEVDYAALSTAYEFAGREMPLKRIRFENKPGGIPVEGSLRTVRLQATGIDGNGNVVSFWPTAFFVERAQAANEEELNRANSAFQPESLIHLTNQRLALADDDGRQGNTTLNVESLKLAVIRRDELRAPLDPPFIPRLAEADVRIPALEHLLGSPVGGAGGKTTITLHDKYLEEGFVLGDTRQVFAKFPAVPPLEIPADRAGGLATPKFSALDGLSRTRGPVAGVDQFASNLSLPIESLIGNAKLLGMIPLKDILIAVVGPAADNLADLAPEALFDAIGAADSRVTLTRPVMATVRRESHVETRFLWKPQIRDNGLPAPLAAADAGPLALVLRGRINKALGPSLPTFEVHGRLANFALEFAGLLKLNFRAVEFQSGAGRKMSAKVDFKDLAFIDDLRFLEKLRPLFSSFGAGPFVKPQPDGVTIGYAVPIPAISLGAMNLQNVALALAVSLPFVEGRPAAVRFSLSERRSPFLVSVSIFGGTGYFSLEVRTDKTVQIEAAIEFGGVVALNLFIVKGGVYAFVGVFVGIASDGRIRVTGHVRLGGYVDVLGLITVSIEVYVGLEYDSGRNILAGEGRLTVSVSVLFFSKSFSITVRKEVAGFGDAPNKRRMLLRPRPAVLSRAVRATPAMNAEQWRKYCRAFG